MPAPPSLFNSWRVPVLWGFLGLLFWLFLAALAFGAYEISQVFG